MKLSSVALLLLTAAPVAETHSLRNILHFLGLDHNDSSNNKESHNGVRRRLEDFLDQAEAGKETDMLEDLEQNGDAEDVSIVDNVNTAEEEDMDLEDEELAIEEDLVDQEGFTEEELLLERRQFVAYTPSAWEQQWVDQIDDIMSAQSLCDTLLGIDSQRAKLHAYMEMLCVTAIDNWCFYTDHSNHYLWYNRDNYTDFELHVDYTPEFLRNQELPSASEPIMIEADDDFGNHPLASKFTYHDQFTDETYDEFLEPLVSHLRFPLAECLDHQPVYLADFQGYVIPPKYLDRTDGRVILYDVGSSDWSRLQYVTEQWKIQGIEMDFIASYAATGTSEDQDLFVQTVPEEYAKKVYRHYFTLTDQEQPDGLENPDNPDAFFLPSKLKNQTVVNDYIIVQLGRSVPAAYKDAMLDYLVTTQETIHIDELLIQVNPSDMYALGNYYDQELIYPEQSSKTTGGIYRTLSALRAKGIRAHAWV